MIALFITLMAHLSLTPYSLITHIPWGMVSCNQLIVVVLVPSASIIDRRLLGTCLQLIRYNAQRTDPKAVL